MLEEQGAHHRVALLRGEGCLGVDVGHQPIPEFYEAPKGSGEPIAVLPRFGGRCAVTAAVGREYAERKPPEVEVLGALLREPTDKMTPEGEPAQPEREASP